MNTPQLDAPSAGHLHDFNMYQDRSRSASRSNSQTTLSSSSSRGPMTIPNSLTFEIPPPLPPPRFNHELAEGHDIGWNLANLGGCGKLAPIKGTSSLFGGYIQCLPSTSAIVEEPPQKMDFDSKFDRRTVSRVHSPFEPVISPGACDKIQHQRRAQKSQSPSSTNQRSVQFSFVALQCDMSICGLSLIATTLETAR